MPYEHLGLTRWPFPIVPQPDFCDFIADRQRLRNDVDSLLLTLSRQDTSSIHLLWSWFGAGKTHTLYYLANRATQLNGSPGGALFTVYSEFPKSARSFVDVYRAFVSRFQMDDLIDAYLEMSTSPVAARLHREFVMASPDLARALHVMATGRPQDQVTAMRWLRGESLPVAEFRRVGISQRIGTSDEATQILIALVHLLAQAAQLKARSICRVVWLLDEYQRIERLPSRVREEISVGLHSTFNGCPSGLTVFLSFSGRPQDRLPAWFTRELRDRIGRTKVLILPPMLPDEALIFVGDVLSHLRTAEAWDKPRFFPFTEEACRTIIYEVQKSEELKPRALMHAFNAVLQESDPRIETGEISEISAQFAKRVLADYAPPAEIEDA